LGANSHIRPINLIQVEATGKDQRKEGKVHSDDVKEYLISSGLAQPDEIAIKTSTTNDIENIDLLSDACPVRFIITRQALQEGWDCPFAYSLTILGHSRSKTALTQLVGRVLRQPYARKTGVRELDESYVFCRHGSSRELLDGIKRNLENEGLGDLYDRIRTDTDVTTALGKRKRQTLRPKYEQSLDDFCLPAFVVPDDRAPDGVRLVEFERDILPEIDFGKVDFSALREVHLDPTATETERITGISFRQSPAADKEEFLELQRWEQALQTAPELRRSYFVQNVIDYVPNPWQAKEVVEQALAVLREGFSEEEIARHQIFLLSEVEKILRGDQARLGELNRLARTVFDRKLKEDRIRLVLKFGKEVLQPEGYFEREQMLNLQLSLFEPVPAKSFNELETDIAYKIDERSDRTFWWYRNWDTRDGFRIVGWQKRRFFPDFILTIREKAAESFIEINLLEPKGGHLAHTLDTVYKQELAKVYEKTPVRAPWQGQEELFAKKPKRVAVVFLDEGQWESRLNEVFG
jgi:type III restriction enzyme